MYYHVASMSPKCLGANLMSVTDVRESTKLVRFTQWLWGGCSVEESAPERENKQDNE